MIHGRGSSGGTFEPEGKFREVVNRRWIWVFDVRRSSHHEDESLPLFFTGRETRRHGNLRNSGDAVDDRGSTIQDIAADLSVDLAKALLDNHQAQFSNPQMGRYRRERGNMCRVCILYDCCGEVRYPGSIEFILPTFRCHFAAPVLSTSQARIPFSLPPPRNPPF